MESRNRLIADSTRQELRDMAVEREGGGNVSFNILEQPYSEVISRKVAIDQEIIAKACKSVIKAIQTELPEEAQSVEIFDYVLKESGKMLRSLPIKL